MKVRTRFVCLLASICAGGAATAGPPGHAGGKDELPLKLTIVAPDAGPFKGLTTLTSWPLILRIEAAEAVALVEASERGVGRREAIVLTDPDGCVDMRDFPLIESGRPYEDCAGPDETYVEFTTERIDSFDLEDGNTGNFQVRERLVDDVFVDGAILNKPYLRKSDGSVAPLPRPQTGEDLLDGYGFGPDDDLPGLVLMADIGAARVFDADFNLVSGVVRNLGGFINTVSSEVRTRRGATALTASMHVLAGLLEPVVLVDLDVAGGGADFLRRFESGPVQAFDFLAPPANDDALFLELVSTYSPFEIELRAVMVAGVGPTFIEDANGDGRYTATDLELMGYTLLSNEARLRLREEVDLAITQTSRGRTCPPQSLIFADLDGNGASGAIPCSGSGGASRLVRPPQ